MHCVICGRRLRKAAATIPASDAGPTPHPAGAVGPTCARNAGLVRASLFTRSAKKRITTGKREKARRESGQLDWIGA